MMDAIKGLNVKFVADFRTRQRLKLHRISLITSCCLTLLQIEVPIVQNIKYFLN